MTVTYLKDGRIKVDKAYDAILLTLAGIRLESYKRKWKFPYAKIKARLIGEEKKLVCECNFPLSPNHNEHTPNKALYVPADVARGLVTNTSDGGVVWDYLYGIRIADGDILKFDTWDDEDSVYMRRHNDRWNLLPEIEIEMEK